MSSIALSSNIPMEWQGAIDRLKKLPDRDWLKDCRTGEQREFWSDCKLLCQFLRVMLEDYFGGRETDFGNMSRSDRDFWVLNRDRWIRLYDAIQLGWSHIKAAAGRDGVSIPDQPGGMLILLLENWAAGLFSRCVAGFHPELGHFSPRKIRGEYLARYQTTLQRPIPKIKTHEREMWHFEAHEFYCLIVLRQHCKRDRLLGQKIKAFDRIETEIESSLMSLTHSRHKLKGHQWRDGRKTPAV